jgi:hypothetical protein
MRARSLLTTYVNERLGPQLVEACRRAGVELELGLADRRYTTEFAGADHVITWGVKMPQSWYGRKRKNVLYLENGLLCQRAGVWIDAGGWFAGSALCRERHFAATPASAELERLERIAHDRFRWRLFGGGDPRGPILFAVQAEGDAPCRYHFPARDPALGVLTSALRLLAEHLPTRPIVIRPHPRFRDQWEGSRDRIIPHLRRTWSVEASPDVYATLRHCSALVTVNSTLATEALCLGLPVATLGEGAYTGSGATLECARDPGRLAALPAWRPDLRAVTGYLCAVLRHQLPYAALPAEVCAHPDFRCWVAAIR